MNKLFFLLSAIALTIISCGKDRDEHNEEEVITTLQLHFVPAGGGPAFTFQFDDPDGPGGADPVIDPIILSPGQDYQVTLQLLNKTVNPAEDITTEIAAEAESHRFYYEPSPGSNITISGLDQDSNGVPLGITSTWTTGSAATGTVKITLRHYAGNPPNKQLADPVDSPKSTTDAEVVFNSVVQ